jgi:hypothetical protein
LGSGFRFCGQGVGERPAGKPSVSWRFRGGGLCLGCSKVYRASGAPKCRFVATFRAWGLTQCGTVVPFRVRGVPECRTGERLRESRRCHGGSVAVVCAWGVEKCRLSLPLRPGVRQSGDPYLNQAFLFILKKVFFPS